MNLPAWAPRWSQRWALALELLLQKRLKVFALLNSVVLLKGIGDAIVEGDEPRAIFVGVVTFPLVVLALPAMADVIALERRAGSLDLALTSSRVEIYFLRPVLAVCGLLVLQGSIFLLLSALLLDRPFPLPLALLHTILITALAGAIVLFWAVRLKSYAGVWMASLITFIALGKWTFRNPIPLPYEVETNYWLPEWEELARWGWNSLLLAVAILLFFTYARRRLRRPETML